MDRIIRPFLDPDRSIPLFLLGSVTIALIIQFATSWADAPGVWRGSYTLTAIALALTVIAILWVWYQQRPKHIYLLQERMPRKRQGLVLLVSAHKGAAPAAIEYHLPTLRHCWLIATDASLPVAAELATVDFVGKGVDFHFGTEFRVTDDDAASTYRVARRIMEHDGPGNGLAITEIIADVTGGSKPMSLGLFAACLASRKPMQYIVAEKRKDGRAVQGAFGEPIRIDFTFDPKIEGDEE